MYLLLFPLQQKMHESVPMLHYTYTVCPVKLWSDLIRQLEEKKIS